ncbi:MAG: primosomal protein N', partial [Treponema sp.]|nr:primosomal protein N' [Treponema sp.]
MPTWYDLVFDIPGDRSFTYRADEKGLAGIGKRAMVPFGRRGADSLGFIVGERDELPAGLGESAVKAIRRVVDSAPVFDRDDIDLAGWIADFYLCGRGQALAAMIPSGRRSGEYPQLGDDASGFSGPPLSLSAEQESALKAILEADTGPESGKTGKRAPMFYLYGITGSGKTEVFLRAAA